MLLLSLFIILYSYPGFIIFDNFVD